MTKKQLELLKELIAADQRYRNQYATWISSDAIKDYPMVRMRCVETGFLTNYQNRTADSLVEQGLAEWELGVEGVDKAWLRLANLAGDE